jgi:hypothetical protein
MKGAVMRVTGLDFELKNYWNLTSRLSGRTPRRLSDTPEILLAELMGVELHATSSALREKARIARAEYIDSHESILDGVRDVLGA